MERLLCLCLLAGGFVLRAEGQDVSQASYYHDVLNPEQQYLYFADNVPNGSKQTNRRVFPTTLLQPVNKPYPQYPVNGQNSAQGAIYVPNVTQRSTFSPDVRQQATNTPAASTANRQSEAQFSKNNDNNPVKDFTIGQQPVYDSNQVNIQPEEYWPLPFNLRAKIEFDATSTALTNFSLNLMRKALIQRQGNLIVSPYSIASLLSLLQQGATDEALLQISYALQMNPQQSSAAYKSQSRNIQNLNSRNILRSANNIFLANAFQLNSNFRTVAQRDFESDLTPTSFDNPDQAAKQVNEWVANKTDNKITKILSPESIAANTQMVLVNAIYFKGLWQIPFRPASTKSDTFYLRDGTSKTVPFMETRRTFIAGIDAKTDSKVVLLPFEREEFSLMIILPSTLSNAHDAYGLLTVSRLQSYLNMRPLEVLLKIPKFTIKADTNLTPVLTQLGVTKIFEQNSGLSNLVKYDTYTPQVSSAVHSAVLSIDEEGGSAGAATAFAVVALSNDEPSLRLKMDRPFVAILWDMKTKVPLFMAVIEEPIL